MTKARACGGKQRHATKTAAEDHRWSLIRGGTALRSMVIYLCPHCGSWHVGHRKRRRR